MPPSMIVVLMLSLTACRSFAQETEQVNRNYKLLRENEDWSALKDPLLRQDVWDPLKFIRLRNGRNDWYMTIGGEVRLDWERIGNDNWGQQPIMNGYLLQRYMLHVDTHYGRYFRTFIQLKSGIETFRAGGPRPIDEKKLDFLAAYLEFGSAGEHDSVKFRVGRQELNYGSGRLVSVREGPNVRQSFDGFKVRSRFGAWSLDAFAVRPDLDRPGFFDNIPDHKTAFWGVYSTRSLSKSVSIDLYYLDLDRKRAAFDRGTAQESRQSTGVRVWRPIPQQQRRLDFDYEGVWQFGSFGAATIRAWTIASDTGYSFPEVRSKPRFSLKADISSGDNPGSHTMGTFNPIFPIGNYFGVIASTGPGPVNFIDLHPRVQAQLPHSVTVSVDWVAQWRESVRDGVYAVPGFLIRSAGDSDARFVGHRPGIEVRWNVDRHLWLQADYGIFFAGRFLKETRPGQNLNYSAVTVGYKL
jgi:hypothetical protein